MVSRSVSSQSTTVAVPSTEIETALSYCEQCLTLAELQKRRIDNQKAEIVTYSNIVSIKDLEINGLRAAKNILIKQYYQSEKEKKRARIRAWFNGLWQGIGIGASLVIIFL